MKTYFNISLIIVFLFSTTCFAQTDSTTNKNNLFSSDSVNNLSKKTISDTIIGQDSLLLGANNVLFLKYSIIKNENGFIKTNVEETLDVNNIRELISNCFRNPIMLMILVVIIFFFLIILFILSLLQLHKIKKDKLILSNNYKDLTLKINDMEKSITEKSRKQIETTLINIKDFLINLISENNNSSLIMTNRDLIEEINQKINVVEKAINQKNGAITEYIESLIDKIICLKNQNSITNKELETYKKELSNNFSDIKLSYRSIEDNLFSLKNRVRDISCLLIKNKEIVTNEDYSISEKGINTDFIEFENNEFGISFNKHKITGKGEDSDPILLIMKNQKSLIGVFDGLGGSGSTKYEIDGFKYTGAFLSSRIVAKTVKGFFERFSKTNEPFSNKIVLSLKNEIQKGLNEAYGKLSIPNTRIKSKMIQKLPTTCALVYCEKEDEIVNSHICWAGDSRCYIQTKEGLSQLSKDDTRYYVDAFEGISNDPPMSNCINLDDDFHINYIKMESELPCLYIVATDGAYNYIPVPYYLEYHILDSIDKAENLNDINMLLINKLKSAGDDISLSIIGFGISDINFLKNHFKSRLDYLRDYYYLPTESILINESLSSEMFITSINYINGNELSIDHLWQGYQKTYEKYFKV